MSEIAALLGQASAGKAHAVVLIEGDEYLARTSARELAEAIVPSKERALNLIVLDAAAGAREIASHLVTVGMFAAPKAVVVEGAEAFAEEVDAERELTRVRELWQARRQRDAARRLLKLVRSAGGRGRARAAQEEACAGRGARAEEPARRRPAPDRFRAAQARALHGRSRADHARGRGGGGRSRTRGGVLRACRGGGRGRRGQGAPAFRGRAAAEGECLRGGAPLSRRRRRHRAQGAGGQRPVCGLRSAGARLQRVPGEAVPRTGSGAVGEETEGPAPVRGLARLQARSPPSEGVLEARPGPLRRAGLRLEKRGRPAIVDGASPRRGLWQMIRGTGPC